MGWKEERTIPTLNTAVVLLLIVYFYANVVMRVGWEPCATKRFVRGAVNERQSSKKIQECPITFSEATTHVNRVQSRVCESTECGNEGGPMLKISMP